MPAEPDLLRGAEWECAPTPAGEAAEPEALSKLPLRWVPAAVPGTVAGAWRDAGLPELSSAELDGSDWWFRCRFDGSSGSKTAASAGGAWVLELDGLATVSDVWLNARHLLRSESMFVPARLSLDGLSDDNRLAIRFSALTPLLEGRRPRPRWKTQGASHQNLRWFRTTLLGRQPGWTVTPAPVGPWRPVRILSALSGEGLRVTARRVWAEPAQYGEPAGSGTVTVELRGETGGNVPAEGHLEVAGTVAPLEVVADGPTFVARGTARVHGVETWWPHTHGAQPRYRVTAMVGRSGVDLGQVGFRSVSVDRTDDAFSVSVNGVPVFCRGGCWYPVDPVSFNAPVDEVRRTLLLVQRAGFNMVRIPGGTVYEDEAFFALCDELGILVWQDAMFAFLDSPDDEDFAATVSAEVTDHFTKAAAHPCLAVLCGGQETEEQPAYFGLERSKWPTPLLTERVRDLAASCAPGTPYLTSSPSGEGMPFRPGSGVCHYTGVGVFLRPLDDLRRAAPRFVSEGLAFAIPPDAVTVEEGFGGAKAAGHAPEWKRSIHHDTGGSWDLEDVRNHYTTRIFDVDVALLRRTDPERALDLGRATMADIMSAAVSEWRRPDSPCAGLLLVGLRDLRVGAGWGVIDAAGRPKAAYFALSRLCQPVAVLATDEGLDGLALHLVNDGERAVAGRLVVELCTATHRVEQANVPVDIPGRGARHLRADDLFDGFRDVSYAYRFGPRPYEVVLVRLMGEGGALLAETAFLPGGPARGVQHEIGLQAGLDGADGKPWDLSVSTRCFAQWVSIDVPGYRPDDSWFHLAPGEERLVGLVPERGSASPPRGYVRAMNTEEVARVSP